MILFTVSILSQTGHFGVVFLANLLDEDLDNPREVAVKTLQGESLYRTVKLVLNCGFRKWVRIAIFVYPSQFQGPTLTRNK